MKKLMFIILIVGNLSTAMSQEAKEILEKHFNEHGQRIWSQIESVIVDGRWVTEEYKGYPMKLTYKQPEKIRMEGTWKGKQYVETTNGKVAWTIAPWSGSSEAQLMRPLEALIIANTYHLGSPLKLYENDLQFNGLVNFKDELYLNYTFQTPFITKEYYLNKSNYRLIWEVIETKSGVKRFSIEKQFEKYRTYNSLLVPTAVRIFSEKGERELIFDDVILGAGASNKIFEMPLSE